MKPNFLKCMQQQQQYKDLKKKKNYIVIMIIVVAHYLYRLTLTGKVNYCYGRMRQKD